MIGSRLKLILVENQAFLLPNIPIPLDRIGIFQGESKRFLKTAYWEIKVIDFNDIKSRLICEIISYNIGEIDFDLFQIENTEILKNVTEIFPKSIDTNGLLYSLAGIPKTSKLLTSSYLVESSIQKTNTEINQKDLKKAFFCEDSLDLYNSYIDSSYEIKENFQISIKDLNFKFGGVSFWKKLKQIENPIEITIFNSDIREEFDAVKGYFSNILKTNKIKVSLKINISAKNYEITSVYSPEISKINKELIETVKFEFVNNFTKQKVDFDSNNTFMTFEDYFEPTDDGLHKPNPFYNNYNELFEDIITISNAKHYKNLRYLSSLHAHYIMKLRFILKPFSFLFLVEGENKYHLIWETLNTEEATYIWHIVKNRQVLINSVNKLEDIINTIKVQGKIAYISESEDPFRRIYHDYSSLIDGFSKWKGEIDSVLN